MQAMQGLSSLVPGPSVVGKAPVNASSGRVDVPATQAASMQPERNTIVEAASADRGTVDELALNLATATLLVCRDCKRQATKKDFTQSQLRKAQPRCRACSQMDNPSRGAGRVAALHEPPAELIDAATSSATALHGHRPLNFGYMTYVDKLFSLACFPELVALRVFPSAKDVSESMAALAAARRHLDGDGRPAGAVVRCVVVGDGNTPRTATLAAFLTEWQCVSVDPAMKPGWQGGPDKHGVQRLTCHALTWDDYVAAAAEEARAAAAPPPSVLVLIAVHSHHRFRGGGSVDAARRACGDGDVRTVLVSMPCCHKYSHAQDCGLPHESVDDFGVFSACRRINVWKWAAGVAAGECVECVA